MKIFFRLVRAILGPLLLAGERWFSPKALQRSPEEQSKVDQLTSQLALYQFETCPFCMKVRREIKRLGLQIELRDARNNETYRDELVRGGGELQVPCLKIPDPLGKGGYRWMYESDDINAYLRQQFG